MSLVFIFADDNYCKKKDDYYLCKQNNVTFKCYNYFMIEINNEKYLRCYRNNIQQDIKINKKSHNKNKTLHNKSNYTKNKYDTYDNDNNNYSNNNFKCGAKRYCSQMSSCEEAYFYLEKCGVKRLDRDRDGIPCEKICK